MTKLSDAQWQEYETEGHLVLRSLIDPAAVQVLQNRIDAIMLGDADVDYDRMLMQLDSDGGNYAEAGPQTKGHKGATLDYRKIQDLEYDRVFLDVMRHPVFKDACDRVYGSDTTIACNRAMFMNKPAGKGTFLPWHQDRWTNFDRDPLLTVWMALDPATKANGCVRIIPRSHRMGVINPSHASGFLADEQAAVWAPPEKEFYVELEPGDVALLHNHLLHGSNKNHSQQSRRAFSVCYMDAATVDSHGHEYPVVFGEQSLESTAATRTSNK
ncbi:MAG: phytanoyl-CoA dioxygenase family protein [Verrucomicrobia bacterium]|nr:phytanoyl-CoA dioxygenase family protein [Verrucomicrobiota bacterium]MDA1087976.1 phytanoyl-CoA dioxygenase family protein [Verrucomicrobiota bacterium]